MRVLYSGCPLVEENIGTAIPIMNETHIANAGHGTGWGTFTMCKLVLPGARYRDADLFPYFPAAAATHTLSGARISELESSVSTLTRCRPPLPFGTARKTK